MKLKNTLTLAISTLIAATSLSALAQGQGSVEGQISLENQSRNIWESGHESYYWDEDWYDNDEWPAPLHRAIGGSGTGIQGSYFNPGIRIGYFLTDDVSINLSYDKIDHNDPVEARDWRHRTKIRGGSTSLTLQYHFGQAGVDYLRPYVEAGLSRDRIRSHDSHSGTSHWSDSAEKLGMSTPIYSGGCGDALYDHHAEATTLITGVGVKCYFTNNLFARVGVKANYEVDDSVWDYSGQVGLGFNLGGNANAAPGK